jgi:hypothetical protein
MERDLGYESDALTGLNSVGYNRVRLGFGGPITGNLSFYLSGDLLGQTTGGSADFAALARRRDSTPRRPRFWSAPGSIPRWRCLSVAASTA